MPSLDHEARYARLRCPCVLLVVTCEEATARWAATPIDLGQPGAAFRPLVLGPAAVPVVTDRAEARRAPELAVLSAMAHGQRPRGADVALAAMAAAGSLDDENARLYADLGFQHLGTAARACRDLSALDARLVAAASATDAGTVLAR